MTESATGRHSEFTRRQVLAGGAAGLAALYLSACSNNNPSASSTAGAGSGDVDLLWDWSYNGPPGSIKEFWNEIRERLADGSGPTVDQLTSVTFENLQQKIETFHSAQTGPALEPWYPAWNAFVYYKQGLLAPIGDYLSEEEMSHWLLIKDSNFDGKHYAASVVAEIALLAVNRDLLSEAGVEVGDEFMSYEEFIDACDRLSGTGITPIVCGSSDAFNAEKWYEFLSQRYLDSPAQYPRAVTGEEPLDGPVMGNWLRELAELRDNYMNADAADINESQATEKFLAGEGAMMLVYPAVVFDPSMEGSPFDVVGFPAGPGQFSRPLIGAGTSMQLLNYAENVEGAAKILEFIHQPEQTSLWWELTKNLPTDDRFDSSILPATAKKTWDLILKNREDSFPILWPDNFIPFDVYVANSNGTAQRIIAGASSEEGAAAQEEIFVSAREGNPEQTQLLTEYAETIDSVLAGN